MTDDLDWDQLLAVHRAESEERLDGMEAAVLDLERGAGGTESIESLRRDTHTLKGNAGMFGFNALATLAHAFEDGLEALASAGPSRTSLETMLRAIDMLRATVANAEPGQDPTPEQTTMAARLRALGSAVEAAPSPVPGSGAATPIPARAEAPDESRSSRATLRVDLGRVEALVELASEIAIARGRLETVLASATLPREARDALDEAVPLLSRLNDVALGMRLVPFGPVLAAHRRTARDAAGTFAREVRLETEGDDVEIDLALVDRVNEILLHLVRNAVAHGIESPADREAGGKPRVGTIRVAASAGAGQVFLDVRDDGRGLDLSAIRARARRLGLEPSGDDRLDAELVFAAGLSTASSLTEVAGRGIGLDSVKAAIERLAGSIEVTFEPGRGTQFRVRLPLTLAMIRGLYAAIGTERYVVPLEAVVECLPAPPGLAFGADGMAFLPRPDDPLAVLRVGAALLDNPGGAGSQIIVVSHGGRRLGLLVDAIVGEGRVVVKPLGRVLHGTPNVFGAAILGDGYVALILDVADIVGRATFPGSSTASRRRPPLPGAH